MGPASATVYFYEDPWRASTFFFAFLQLLLTVLVLVHTVILCIACQLMKWFGREYPDGICQGDAILKPLDLHSNGSRQTPLISAENSLKYSRSEDWRALKSRSFECPKCYGVWNLKQGLSFRYESGARDGAGHGTLHFASVNFDADNCVSKGYTESSSNTPVHDLPRLGKEAATEFIAHREASREEVASSLKELNSNWMSKAPLKSNGAEEDLQSSGSALSIQKEIQKEVMDEDFSAVLRKEDDNKEGSYESVINGSLVERISALNDDKKGCDSESVIKGLKEAVFRERKKLCTLYAELEIERISSETAANETMSMMSRLQEEKAAFCMQAAYYRRIAEERAIYDEQTMQLLKDILVKKEKENFLLEKEVKAMRTRCCRDVRTYGKKRQGVDTPEFCEMLLLKNEDADWVRSPGSKKEERGKELSSWPVITEKKPLKRLKGNMNYENLSSQKLFLASELHSNTQSALYGGNETRVLNAYCSCEHQLSHTSTKNKFEEVFDNGHVIQEKATVSQGELVISENEKLLDKFDNEDESLEGLIMSSSTLSTAAESVQGWKLAWSDTSDGQGFLLPVIEEDSVKKRTTLVNVL